MSTRACTGWNWMHECQLPAEHSGDHRCGGCGDVWNRGPWDDDDDQSDRPHERCDDALVTVRKADGSSTEEAR